MYGFFIGYTAKDSDEYKYLVVSWDTVLRSKPTHNTTTVFLIVPELKMEASLDNATIRNSTPADLAKYLRSALTTLDSNTISTRLLNAVAIESIPPTIFDIWLSVCHDFEPLTAALQQEHSIRVRKTAIEHFGKWLRSTRASEVWSAVGGTRFLLEFLAQASVHEISWFCKAVGRTRTVITARQQRQTLITELVEALAHEYFPNAKYRSQDQRPILHYYARLVPACTSDFVKKWMSNKSLPPCDASKLVSAHAELVQEQCLDAVRRGDKRPAGLSRRYASLLTNLPPLPSSDAGVSESMAFSMRLLREMYLDDRLVIDPISFWNCLAKPLIRRLYRRRCSIETRVETLRMISVYIQRHCDSPYQLAFESNGIHFYIIRMWARHSEQLQDLLVAYFKLVPARGHDLRAHEDLYVIAALLGTVKPGLRLRLLRLFLIQIE